MSETTSIPIAVIGGGVIGLSVALKLAEKFGPNVVYLFERHGWLGEEQSSRNSGVNHSGIYYPPGSLKAELCVLGNAELYEFCPVYRIPFLKRGKLMLAQNSEEEETLEFYRNRAVLNGVPGVRLIGEKVIKNYEVNVSGKAALFIPSSGVIDAASYIRVLETLAINAGVTILKRNLICDIEVNSSGIDCEVCDDNGIDSSRHYSFRAELLINAAGLNAANVAKMINDNSPYEIQPIRGEYATFNHRKKSSINLRGVNIYTTPKYVEKDGRKYFSVGIHLTPTFEMGKNGEAYLGRTILVGPTADPVDDAHDYENNRHGVEYFFKEITLMLPWLTPHELSLGYSGIRAKIKFPKDDFVIEKDKEHPNCIHVMADSPGLTASLAIAKYVRDKIL